MIYNLTEKFLLLFPFYRELVRVMDSYALRLSEMEEDWRATKLENSSLKIHIAFFETCQTRPPRGLPQRPNVRFKP